MIKKILLDHISRFWQLHDRRFPEEYRDDIYETVYKAIKCGTRDLGFTKYECLGCEGKSKPVFIGFTCKSRFCHTCAKKYNDEWFDKQEEMIFDVSHRHMVLRYQKSCEKFLSVETQ
ncbi:transposase zinc-binding domain-containing protein [Salipaludibacillus sp. CF4.18]|uniref:transposase zinc-binding domain-containing protein n=1 Tax=Salipaludibacillus sp. CF4.18 TaxID=3373081 RepID=UPI003EE4CEAF